MEISMQMNQTQNLKTKKNIQKLKLPMFQIVSMQISERKKTNFYELLSLNSQNVGLDEIKKAYKSLALRYHPDVCGAPLTKEESTRRFIELREAYETLSDPNSRRTYDYELSLELGYHGSSSYHDAIYGEDSRNRNCPREVWEMQLLGLRKHCSERMNRRK